MTAHCPLCKNPVTPAQRSSCDRKIAERKNRLAASLDALMQRHRLAEECAEKAAERAYEKGREKGAKESEYDYKRTLEMRKIFTERKLRPPPALLARPSALLSGLRKKFPKDRFKVFTKGQGIVQTIRVNGKDAGCVVYTCRPDTGSFEELDTREVASLKERCRARAGIQVVRSARNNADGHGVFIICQKMALSFAAVVREGVLLCARKQDDSTMKQEIISRFAA